jgi:excisionase family DNA binding protein
MDDHKTILDKLDTIEQMLTRQAEALTLQKDVLNLKEACAYLDISASHLYKLTSENRIPHSKPNGKRVYFSRAELDAWLLGQPIKTREEIERAAANYSITGNGRRRNAQ